MTIDVVDAVQKQMLQDEEMLDFEKDDLATLPVKVTYPDIWTAAESLARHGREAWGNAGKVEVIIRGKE